MPEIATSVHPVEQSRPDASLTRLIAGMSRGGTTWAGKCLNEHSQVSVFGETLFWGRKFIPPGPDGRYNEKTLDEVLDGLTTGFKSFAGTGPGSLKNIDESQGPDVISSVRASLAHGPTPTDVFTTYGREIARRESKPIYIEKSPHNLLWIDRIAGACSPFRMLVLVRDPYEFMLSYKHQGDRKPLEVRKQFEGMYHPFGCAMVWRGYARAARRARRAYPDNTLMVSFEEMTDASAESMARIQSFFELPEENIAQRVPPDNSSFPDGARPTLKPVDIWWMNLVARHWIEDLGYTRRRSGFPLLGILGSLFTLVPWGLRSYRAIARTQHASTLSYILNWIRPRIGGRRSDR